MNIFKKTSDGNYYNVINDYYLGVDTDFILHMVKDNDWTPQDIIEHTMQAVNDSLKGLYVEEG